MAEIRELEENQKACENPEPLSREEFAGIEQVREQLEYWGGKLAEAEAEEKQGGRNRAYRALIRDV